MERRLDSARRVRLIATGPGRGEFHAGLNRRNLGEGLRASFVDAPKFEEKTGVKVSQEFAIDSVFTAKAMATSGTPPFSTLAVLQAEANFLALGGCLQDYDLDICTNYKDIIDSAKEPPRGQLKNWFTPFVLIVMGLVYNTKEASKPTSYQDLLNPKYKGRVGIPTYGWVGNSWLQVLNKTLGGNEDNVDPGIAFLAELVKKNDAVIIENTDAALKAFTREEIVIMPFWNGRTFVLQGQGVPVDIEYIPGHDAGGRWLPGAAGRQVHRADQPLLQHHNGRSVSDDDDAALLLSAVESKRQATDRSGALRVSGRQRKERSPDRLREDERAQWRGS
jgi:spermidine/putrescine-binding protein